MKRRIIAWLGVLAFGVAASASAHHSAIAEYDLEKPVKVTGTVTRVEWSNPHIWFYVDVKDDAGKVSQWQCEGGAPNSLTRNGWTKNSLKQGDAVTVDGYLAKDGKNTLNARTIKMADGKTVFAGSSNDKQ